MDDDLKANYVALVESGVYTWKSLEATADANGWDDILAVCRHHKTASPGLEKAVNVKLAETPEGPKVKPKGR